MTCRDTLVTSYIVRSDPLVAWQIGLQSDESHRVARSLSSDLGTDLRLEGCYSILQAFSGPRTNIQERQNEFSNALRGQAITEEMLLADSLIRVSTNDLVPRKKNGEVYIHNFRVRVRDVPRLVDHLRGQNRDDYAVQRLCDQLAQAAIGKDPGRHAFGTDRFIREKASTTCGVSEGKSQV